MIGIKAMIPKLTKAEYLNGYKIRVSFENGTTGIIDLENELWGEVFEPLTDLALFQAFEINEELQTIVWPTGADLAPEYLYQRAAA
jgi:hypothetical protein